MKVGNLCIPGPVYLAKNIPNFTGHPRVITACHNYPRTLLYYFKAPMPDPIVNPKEE